MTDDGKAGCIGFAVIIIVIAIIGIVRLIMQPNGWGF